MNQSNGAGAADHLAISALVILKGSRGDFLTVREAAWQPARRDIHQARSSTSVRLSCSAAQDLFMMVQTEIKVVGQRPHEIRFRDVNLQLALEKSNANERRRVADQPHLPKHSRRQQREDNRVFFILFQNPCAATYDDKNGVSTVTHPDRPSYAGQPSGELPLSHMPS